VKKFLKSVFFDIETYKLSIIFVIVFSAILVIDYKDIITNYLVSGDLAIAIIIGSCIAFVVLLFLFRHHFFDMIVKIPTVNGMDRVTVLCCATAALYFVSIHLINQVYKYKCFVLIIAFVLCLSLFVFRIIRYCVLIKNSEVDDSFIVDFKSVVENSPKSDDKFPVLISEKDVDYDLFGRSEIIFQLLLAIKMCCMSNAPFVIGLSGEWGSGKTTILNNVKKYFEGDEKTVIVDGFDPWVYSSPNALLIGMYYTILQKTGVHYNNFQIKELINIACNIVEDSKEAKSISRIAKSILSQERENDSIKDLKSMIDDYLRAKNKTIVFFIDNLDRATAENVRFVFKLVGAVLDFERVKYVLSYDPNRLAMVFKDSMGIDPRYIEKIINQELVVPKISNEIRGNIFRRAMTNLLVSNGVHQNDLTDYEDIFQFIIDEVDDVRKFKRILNSVFFLTFANNSLYKPDLLMIETIRFLDMELYESIYQNRQFFIDSDTQFDKNTFYALIRREEFNSKCKSYFDELFKDREQYKSLLSEAFPYVNNYNRGWDIRQEYTDPERHKDTQLHSRINSAKFFDLYFSYSINDFLDINNRFDKGIKEVLSSPVDKIESGFSELISSIPEEAQLEWTQKLYLIKDDIDSSVLYPILISLFKNIYLFDNQREFLTPSARERVLSVMANLFSRIDNQDDFIKIMNEDIKGLLVVTELIYWIGENDEESKYKLIEYAKKLCDYILNNNIDIYRDEYYERGNVWAIYHTLKYCDVQNKEDLLKQYIANITNKNNVYRVLGDTVGSSIGRVYSYRIVKENYDILIDDRINIQSLLEKKEHRNSSEQLIYDLYQDYLKYQGDMEHQRQFDYPFEFKL